MQELTEDAALASALRISVSRMARRLRSQQAGDALSATQMATLSTLSRHGPLTPGELAAHERVQPPSMTRVIGVLECAGLVTRTSHPTDGRQALVALTTEGSGRLVADRARRDAWLSHLLDDLEADELATLRAAATLLDRLSQA